VMSFCRSRNLDFMMVVGECSVVQGRLFFSGKLTAALINTSGYLAERLNYIYERDENGHVKAVTVIGRINNETATREVFVRLDDVKTANKVWTTQPEQQLAYAGARIWGRRHMPEVLMGLLFEGEQIIDVTPNVVEPQPSKSPDAHSEATAHTGPIVRIHDEQLAERVLKQAAEPHAIERIGEDEQAWSLWGQKFYAAIKAAPSFGAVDEWIVANSDTLEELKHYDTAKYNALRHKVQAIQGGKTTKARDAETG
jgi:hypothetical protein